MKKVVIIGSGFAGLSAASFLARAGWQVTVLEKHDMPGGRARQFSAEGFNFDMGPSWYWMPDVFERYFSAFGKKVTDYYELQRLDPSYRIYWKDGITDIPADYDKLKEVFEGIEKGSGEALDLFMKEAAYKYRLGIEKLVYKPGQSVMEFMDREVISGIFKLDVFTSMKKHVAKYFKDERLRQLMEFPVLFLGALAKDIPALYSLMNYADIKLGTWYPRGGMYMIVKGMHSLAMELGVVFEFNENAVEIVVNDNNATKVITQHGEAGSPATTRVFPADVVISAADYHFTETQLLPQASRSYSDRYWNSRIMAPGCLLYYVGVKKKLTGILHHSLFFDVDFDTHGEDIYTVPQWPSDPLFYVSAVSVTDSSTAPEGGENLFFLIPVAAGLEGDDTALQDAYFDRVLDRYESRTGQEIRKFISYRRSYSGVNFVSDYNAFKGNAYGLANTLRQTAILKPKCRSKKVKNLFYTGQLTVPGPGVPPSLISGEVVANEVKKYFM